MTTGKEKSYYTDEQFQIAKDLYDLPFFDIMEKAHTIHNQNWDKNTVQVSVLCNIKTGGCPENCSYCPQSAHYQTSVKAEKIMKKEEILKMAQSAKDSGAGRFCIGCAWRGPTDKQIDYICDIVKDVKDMGLQTCVTLGLLKDNQAEKLKEAGLDYYNHNIDSSDDFYETIITTRQFQDRIKTIENVQKAKINVCCGGIIGMGETVDDRLKMLSILANLNPAPKSVPINKLIPIPGTPLAERQDVDMFDFIRTCAIARILMPNSYIRFAAGRETTHIAFQAMCFYVGVNSIFYGEKLLTAKNQAPEKDKYMFEKLGIKSFV